MHLWISGICEYEISASPTLNAEHLLYLAKTQSLPFYFSFQENLRLQQDNEALREKLRETKLEVEKLKSYLKKHALHPVVEEDSSS